MRQGRPSRTALKVALAIVTLGAKPGMKNVLPPGIVEASTRLLVESGVVRSTTMRWAGSRKAVSVYEAFDWMLPGQFVAFAHRKAFFDRQVREALGTGACQVLVLGAGYDTLAWRLASAFPNVNFFEIDHPATARLKAKGLKKMGQPGNLFLIAEDLSQHKLVDVIKADESWDLHARTIILAEGLVMYLPADAVLSLFSQCAELVGDGSRFVFSYIPTGRDGRPDVGRWTGLMLWLQKAVGEPWTWSIQPEELDSFLQGAGWANAPGLIEEPIVQGVEMYAVALKQIEDT